MAVLIRFILSEGEVIKTDDSINGRISTLEANDRNIFHQLDEIKSDVRDIRRLTAAVEKVALQTENTANKVNSIDKRLAFVEQTPCEDMKYYKKNYNRLHHHRNYRNGFRRCGGAYIKMTVRTPEALKLFGGF
ncbi:MAG: hypothetical protein ACLR56_10140 [Oscillospiraceae bacterium]